MRKLQERHDVAIEDDGTDFWLVYNGERIAYCKDAETWVSIKPGYRVIVSPDGRGLEVQVRTLTARLK